jgi:hypothetical protein
MSSSFVHLAVRAVVPSMLGFKHFCHLFEHCFFRSTRNERGNYDPILTTVRFYRVLQLIIFVCCLFARTPTR